MCFVSSPSLLNIAKHNLNLKMKLDRDRWWTFFSIDQTNMRFYITVDGPFFSIDQTNMRFSISQHMGNFCWKIFLALDGFCWMQFSNLGSDWRWHPKDQEYCSSVLLWIFSFWNSNNSKRPRILYLSAASWWLLLFHFCFNIDDCFSLCHCLSFLS